MAAAMMTHPKISRPVRTWPKISHPATAPTALSRLMMRLAIVGFIPFCATICSVYATPLLNHPE